MSTVDLQYMRRAGVLALKAKGETSPNPLVGAVIVKGGKVISEGWHRFCGGDHAEVMALRKAGSAARGAKLYVTMEPCSHFGRTPPCVDKIIAAEIREVVIGMIDPNPLNNGTSIQKLRRAGIGVSVGCLREELNKINEPFLKYIINKLPFVIAKTAQTLDGKIALAGGESRWITSQESRDHAHQTRREFDGILVGINTVLKDNPNLNAAGRTRPIKKIIVDSLLRLPSKSNIFKNTDPKDVIVAVSPKASARAVEHFQKKGVVVIVCPVRKKTNRVGGVSWSRPRLQMRFLFKELARREISSVLIEGGATVIGGALAERLVDKMMIYIAPKIMGDSLGVNSIAGLKSKRINQLIQLRRVEVRRIGCDVLVEGYLSG